MNQMMPMLNPPPGEKGPDVWVTVTDRTLQELIHVGAIIQERIRSFEPALKGVEDALAAAALEYLEDDGEVVFITLNGMRACVRVEYSFGEIRDEDVTALHALLGERYHDLVERQVVLRPTPELIAMACGGDRGREVRKYLTIRRKAPVVRIVAEDPLETGVGT